MQSIAYMGNGNPNQLNLVEGYPKRNREGNQWIFTWRYWCAASKANDNDLIPARNATMPALAGVSGTYYLKTVEVSATNVAGIVYVDLKYSSSESSFSLASVHADGDIDRAVNKTFREIPKDKAIDAGIVDEDEISASQNSVGIVGVEYIYTYYDESFSWTEASVLSYLCEVGTKPTDENTMPGMTGVSDYTKWLCKGQSVRDDGGGITQISTTYVWDFLGWFDLCIFDLATTTAP